MHEAARVVESDSFQRMLEVVRAESPAYAILGQADLAARATHQARTEGYNLALYHLMQLAKPKTIFGDLPEPTFLPEDPEPEQKG